MNCSMPGFPNLHYLLKFAQTHVHWVNHAIQLSYPLSPPSPPAINLSQHQCLFQWVISSFQVSKVLELQLQHQSFQWTLRTDFLLYWLVGSPCSPRNSQGLLQHHSSKVSILQGSAFFIVQLLCPYMTTGKTIALTMWTFVSRIRSLLLNTLSRFVIAFLPRSKCLLILWLQSTSAAQENKVSHCFHCFPIYMPWSDETGSHDLSFLNVEL